MKHRQGVKNSSIHRIRTIHVQIGWATAAAGGTGSASHVLAQLAAMAFQQFLNWGKGEGKKVGGSGIHHRGSIRAYLHGLAAGHIQRRAAAFIDLVLGEEKRQHLGNDILLT